MDIHLKIDNDHLITTNKNYDHLYYIKKNKLNDISKKDVAVVKQMRIHQLYLELIKALAE